MADLPWTVGDIIAEDTAGYPDTIEGRIQKTLAKGPKPARPPRPAALPAPPVKKYDPVARGKQPGGTRGYGFDDTPESFRGGPQEALSTLISNIIGTVKEIPGSISSGQGGILGQASGAVQNLAKMAALSQTTGGRATVGALPNLSGMTIPAKQPAVPAAQPKTRATETEVQTTTETTPENSKRALALTKTVPGLSYEDALIVVNRIAAEEGTSGKASNALKQMTINDVMQDLLGTTPDSRDPFKMVEAGKTAETHIDRLYQKFSNSNKDYDDSYQRWKKADALLSAESERFGQEVVRKELDTQVAKEYLAQAKVRTSRLADKRYKQLDEMYFGREARRAAKEGGIGEPLPGVATGATEGIFQRMSRLAESQAKELATNPKIDLWDFSDEDSWLGVNWKKTGLAIGGIAAMGGQIALSISFDNKVPNFVMPLILRAIDADVESQAKGASERRLRAAGIGSLYKQMLDGYGDAKTAIEHSKLGGIQLAIALLDKVKARVIGKDDQARFDYIKAGLVKAAEEKKQEIIRGVQASNKGEVAFGIETVMRSQQFKNAETQEDATKINGYVALQGFLASLSGDQVELESKAKGQIDEGIKSIASITDMKRMASELFRLEIGPIDQLMHMTMKDIKLRFVKEDQLEVVQKIHELMQATQATVAQIAKAHDPRVSNFDIKNWKEIVGDLDNQSLYSFVSGIYNIEYGVRESVLSKLSAVYKTPTFRQEYGNRLMISFGRDSSDLMEDFLISANSRRKDSTPEAGTAQTAQQSKAALRRLNVGMTGIRVVGAPKFDAATYEAWSKSQITAKRLSSEPETLSENRMQRKEDHTRANFASILPGKATVVTDLPGPRNKDNYPKGATSHHYGVDIRGDIGDAVASVVDGKIEKVGTHKGYGKYVWVRDQLGNIHGYHHLDDNEFFAEGAPVMAGDQIGTVGNTGVSSKSHLHYQVKNSRGQYVNPMPYLGRGWITKQQVQEAQRLAGAKE